MLKERSNAHRTVTGVAAGSAVGAISAGDKINNRREEIKNSVSSANGVHVIGPDTRGDLNENLHNGRRISSPAGANLTRDQAREKLSENGRDVIDELPPEAKKDIIKPRHGNHHGDDDYNCYYHHGNHWYRPIYYDDYVYYETVPVPSDDLVDLDESELKKMTIHGSEYYMYDGKYYIKINDRYLEVDPFR
jgi:hypothetical protein